MGSGVPCPELGGVPLKLLCFGTRWGEKIWTNDNGLDIPCNIDVFCS